MTAGSIEDFRDCADVHAWFHGNGWITLQVAVDNLQTLAERWGLVDELGQDAVQDEMSRAFAFLDEPQLQTDYAARIVRQWEMADPRDRWSWTGEAPPPPQPEVPKPSYRTPQSTIDAFLYVVRLDDSDYLANWLSEHPRDIPHLQKLWGRKCMTASAA